ncbi:MAG: sulfatase-like hydrolase/transferase [Vicinamibacteraceae bacterium]
MHDSQVAAGAPTAPIPASADGTAVRFLAQVRRSARLGSDTLAVFDVFVVLGLMGVYLKLALLAPQWGAVARFLGKRPGEPLGLLDRVGFFANDLTLNLLIIPLVGTIVVSVIFRAWRVAAACAVGIGLSLAYFVELRASSEVGQYISGRMLRDFIGWSSTHPASASDYLTPASILKLAILLVVLGTLLLAARGARRLASRTARMTLKLLLAAPAVVAVTAAVVLAPIAYAVRLPQSPLNTSAVALAATTLLAPADDATAGSPWLSLDDALGSLRQLTHTAAFDRHHALVGREAGSDLLIMMMETGPAQAFELGERGASASAVSRLRAHALVSPQHYTAHPYSSDALFSVLSGTYPHGRRLLLESLPDGQINGLFSGLPADVGLRGIYLPSLYQIELDERMYRAFGARPLYVADRHLDDPLRSKAVARAESLLRELGADRMEPGVRDRLRGLLIGDLQALERVKADVRQAIAGGGRYAVMFFPEIGHGPWPALRPGDGDILSRGRSLMDIQDAWLNELLEVVATGRRLDRTVVAVTADHGLRTRAEYPPLRVGFLNDVMFRVPMLIHAPNAIATTTVLEAPTSHIDLAPTLLALMGAPEAAARMHGIPMWQRTRQDRLYVLASAYGGADGFLENGRFYMHQALSGAVYANDRFAFEDANQVRPGDPVGPFVVDGLGKASDGQHALASRLRGR